MSQTSVISITNNPLIKLIAAPHLRWPRHTLFIIVGLVLAFKGDVDDFHFSEASSLKKAVLLVDLGTFIGVMGMIYLLVFVLVPRLLFRGRVFLFAVCFFIMISLIYLLVFYIDLIFLVPADDPVKPALPHIKLSFVSWIGFSAVGAVLLGAVVGLCIFKKWIVDIEQIHALQEENMQAELLQLKSQVNPHFLFNTLNNSVVLTKTDPEKATQVLLGLSDLLRYQLYDSSKETVLLSKDIQFLENLLSLEKIRQNDFSFDIQVKGVTEGVTVPPFLFIPFVENAIKHGASSVSHTYVKICFSVKSKELVFTSENAIPKVKNSIPGGLGLKNIMRRLELLYPGRHVLEIDRAPDKYAVLLKIPI